MMSFSKKWRSFRDLFSCYRAKLATIRIKDKIVDISRHKTDNIRIVLAKIALLFNSKQKLHDQLLSMEASWNKREGDRYVSFTETGMYMFPKEWFTDYVLMPFEDIKVRVPVYYDAYLTYMYGDYMTPPPIDQRVGEGPHSKVYINLRQNVSLSKIKRQQ